MNNLSVLKSNNFTYIRANNSVYIKNNSIDEASREAKSLFRKL